MKKIPQCRLRSPATCPHQIDGKLSHITLCGGNQIPVGGDVDTCDNRFIDYANSIDIGNYRQIVFDVLTTSEGRDLSPDDILKKVDEMLGTLLL